MKTKQCTKCNQIKSLSEFHKNKSYKDGHQSWCKECYKEYSKQNYTRKTPEKPNCPDSYKYCSNCGKIKPLFEFNKNKSRKDGCGCCCKECSNLYYKENKQKVREQAKKNHCIDCGKKIDNRSKRCLSCASKYMWSNKKFREKRLKNMIKGCNFSQNKKEKQLEEILNELFSDKYKFVGDGKKFIAGLVPDFIDKETKKIIELFGDYWHNREGSKERDKRKLKTYAKYGYKTLIVWEHELEDKNKLNEKLLKF